MNNKIMYNGQVLVDFDALADKYTRAEVDALVSAVFKYKGTVATYADLENIPTADLSVGDCYNVTADGNNYAWTGTTWDKLSGTVDLSNYYTKTQVDNLINSIDLSAYYTKTQVDSKVSTDIAAAITAIPVSDLLHFKGHVNSVEDLPSAGQPSAPEVAPVLSVSNPGVSNTVNSGTINTINGYKGAYNYIIAGYCGFQTSRSYVKFNDYSALDGCCPTTARAISFHFDASNSKSVIVYGTAFNSNIICDDGTTITASTSEQTITKPFWITFNTPDLYAGSYNTAFMTNLDFNVKLKFPETSTGIISTEYNTFKASSTGRNYIEGYYLLQPYGVEAGKICWFKYYNGEPSADAKENNVYSVGSNNLLYRCNASPAWELLSKQDKPVIVTYNSANNTADYTSAQIKTLLDADTPVYLHVEETSGLETINLLLPFVYADDTEAQAVLSNSYSSSGNTSSSTITYSIDTNGDGTMYNVANVTSGDLSDALDDYLATDNTTPYTPLADYNPATKKYVDDAIGGSNNIQYATMPTADATTVDKVVQYVGTTDSNYTNGYFYKGISTTTGSGNEEVTTYSWSLLNVQKLKTINSTAISGSGNIDLLPYNFVYTLSLAGYIGDPVSYTLTASELTNVNNMINHALQRLGTVQINKNMPVSFIISGPATQSKPSCIVTINAGDFSAKRQILYFMGSFASGSTNYAYGLMISGTWSGNVFTASAGMFVTTATVLMTSNNTSSYTPTGNYNPASKLYVDTSAENLANKYDSTATYAIGDYVTYNGVLYKCSTAISTAEDWDSTHWTAVKVDDKFSGKLDSSKVKTAYSTTSGDVYDVTYINSVIGQIDTLLQEL